MINCLNYEGINFPASKTDYCKIEKKNNICINVFSYENDLTYTFYVSDHEFKKSMNLLLISDKINHTMYISKI